jgi:hypothetical protein
MVITIQWLQILLLVSLGIPLRRKEEERSNWKKEQGHPAMHCRYDDKTSDYNQSLMTILPKLSTKVLAKSLLIYDKCLKNFVGSPDEFVYTLSEELGPISSKGQRIFWRFLQSTNDHGFCAGLRLELQYLSWVTG